MYILFWLLGALNAFTKLTIIERNMDGLNNRSMVNCEVLTPSASDGNLEGILRSPVKNFDQRLTSKLSIQQQRHNGCLNKGPIFESDLVNRSPTQSSGTSLNSKKLETGSCVDWVKLSKLSEQIFSATSKMENGEPDFVSISDEYIVIATSKCHILLFSYGQELLLKVKTPEGHLRTRITSLALSVDSTYLAVGYLDGFINLWDLKKSEPIISVRPVTVHELQHNGAHHHIAHLEGTAVRKIMFIGSRHTGFISFDDTGMMILHNGLRSLIGYYCRSRILYGEYHMADIMSKTTDYNKTMLDAHILPIGSKKCITDSMGLLSIITPHEMVILSLHPNPTTQFKIRKPEISDQQLGLSGHVSWFPATTDENEIPGNPPMLAYCWSNSIYVVDIESELIANDLGEKVPILTIVNKRGAQFEESIVSLHWLTRRIIVILTRSQKLLFLNAKSLRELRNIDMLTKQLYYYQIYEGNTVGLVERCYFGSFHTIKTNIFIFQNRNLVIGNLNNWADILLKLLTERKYAEALEESQRQYNGADMALLSLPDNVSVRHALMKNYLIQILKKSLKYMFNSESESLGYRKCTLLAIQTGMIINAPLEIYDLIYEKLLENQMEDLFFDVIEEFILTARLVTFSPTILRSMVEHYTKNDDVNTLEQLICQLNIEHLDIDLTVSLCREFHLNETLTYIWTSLLHDYITPLIDVIKRIKTFYEKIDILSEDEKQTLSLDIDYVYPYISYTLTGRQYPTDKMIKYTEHTTAKLNIYYVLFNGSAISWPEGSPKVHIIEDYTVEPVFPYMCLLLKYDSEKLLSCLNEAFEDDLLNEDRIMSFGIANNDRFQLKVNRQYIVDVLLGLFHDSGSQFTAIDNVWLAIFISRNYPKYAQFIRISDGIANEMVDLLCSASDLEGYPVESWQDCELALQSLLTIYKPIDLELLEFKVEKAKYYRVLMSLYLSEEKYVDVLALWVKLQKNNSGETETWLCKPISELIKQAFTGSDQYTKEKLIKILSFDLELFVKSNPKNIARIVCRLCPELNHEVVGFKDSHLKFEYLKEVFSFAETNEKQTSIRFTDDLKYEYLQSLIKQQIVGERGSHSDENFKENIDSNKNINLRIRAFIFKFSKLDNQTVLLLQENNFQIIIDWYSSKEEYQEAINTVCKILRIKSKELEKNGYSKTAEHAIWKCLDLGFSVLSRNSAKLINANKQPVLKEKLLLQIVETTVGIFTKMMKTKEEHTKIADLFKKVVQSTFQYLINLSQEDSNMFNDIFKSFLDGSSIYVTTLGDVRMILKEIFISYTNDQQILSAIQLLVDGDIFDDLVILEGLKLNGRSPRNIECETCGKKIWGGRVGNQVYESWRDHKLKDVLTGYEINSDIDFKNELIIFKCRHAYHKKCVENMGMTDDDAKECIICRGH